MQGHGVVEVGEEDFEREVVERSRRMAVIVDFWAPWCGPCRILGPLLENLVAERPEELVLAKIDVDRAPELARRFGIRSIPTVLGFRDGSLAAEFEGAQPEPVVRQFVEALLPTEADRRVREGEAHAAAGERSAAEAAFRQALAADRRHPGALLGLARLLAAREGLEEALELLDRVAPGTPPGAEAEKLAAELRTRRSDPGEAAELSAHLARDPEDLAARLALGRSLASAGRHEEALVELLKVVQKDASFADEAARKAMLDVFAVLGPEHALTVRFRAELARALFR